LKIDARMRVCAVIGNPVEHSLSPILHNSAFEKEGLPICYVAFRVEDLAAAMAGVRGFNLLGLSVTIPHKVEVLAYLDEVEDTARQIGSVNTVLNRDGKLIGFNSDGMGALRAIEEARIDLAGRRIAILGSGGAARAIAFSIGKAAGLEEMVLFGVEREQCRRLAEDLQKVLAFPVRWFDQSQANLARYLRDADGIVHCTPVGMNPHPDASLVSKDLLRAEQFVFDIVYTPMKTRLLRDAESVGCRIVPGVEMFLYQAVFQFECWTGRKAPLALMRQVVLECLA
jgi:shikimate dehydrogenase